MIQSIMIPKLVFNQLKSNNKLNTYVNGRIVPLVAEFETQFPYIAFSRTNIIPYYTKDFHTQDTVNVEIVVAATDYLQSLEIANEVRACLECKYIATTEDMTVYETKLLSATEAYDDMANAFVQRLQFSFLVG